MSYIIKSTNPFVSVKLTDIGRQQLSLGRLNFSYWSIGDSEINYDREIIVDSDPLTYSATSRIFRPFDKQPNPKSVITNQNGDYFNTLNQSNISVVKAVVNNLATERGFFNSSVLNSTTLTGDTYIRNFNTLLNTTITGGTVFYIPSGQTVNIGDVIRLKSTNKLIQTGTTSTENTLPLPNLWFKVQSTATTISGTAITVDRRLPNLSNQTGSSYTFIYRGGEVADTFGYDTSTAYWDSGTLSFDSATNITCDDVKVWNMNNVWCENLAGITGLSTTNLYEDYTKFGSYDYLGAKNPYFEYLCSTNDVTPPIDCNGPGYSYLDTVHKSISILHYTNNTISNLYGEFFHVDTINNKSVSITLPNLMYHRRNYGTTFGTTMGMSFIASGTSKILAQSNIEYYNLYENPTLVNGNALVVGKVFPQLKTVVIDDDEIVAAMSYKSNRNWTLPPLSATLSAPTGGTGTGLLSVNDTIYLTYSLDNTIGTGLTPTLPCQTYIKVTNTSSTSKDIAFKLSDIDLLPYMRKIEEVDYDGLGFYATNFKLLYQIVSTQNDRPNPESWKVYDFTTTGLTTTTGGTIDPLLLENQTPYNNGTCDGQVGFVLTNAINSAATTFDLTSILSMAPNTTPDILQFGDERFFYGNLEGYIGATIYKTIFDIRVDSSQFSLTTNPTRSQSQSTNPPDIKLTEMAIYDTNKNLVVIGKLSQPVPLKIGNTIQLEASLDF